MCLNGDDIAQAVDAYGSMLLRVCLTLLADKYDADDALQETFFRLFTKAPEFRDSEHRKAWLIRVAINICKDTLRRRNRETYLSLDDLDEYGIAENDLGVLDSVMLLPVIYREVILLHYIENYKVTEISDILGITEAAVKKRLQYAREKLRLEFDNN